MQAGTGAGHDPGSTAMGIVSLIIWSLIVIVSIKYAILILRADNHGEGGVVAMLALLGARDAEHGSRRAALLVLGLVGAALLYGDGAITPAISVLSAVEGLKGDAPALGPAVVPITVAILIMLFLDPVARDRYDRQDIRAGHAVLVRRHRRARYRQYRLAAASARSAVAAAGGDISSRRLRSASASRCSARCSLR